MNIAEQEIRQKICEDVTQLQVDLQTALQSIFEQAGHRIQPEKQQEVQQKFAGTQQLLEHFKSRYV
jgi:tRNA uridine 5-carbamoylmethylation protein Kti12